MPRTICVLAFSLMAGILLGQTPGQSPAVQSDEPVVFRSDVSLVRVDVQVMDGNRAITGLRAEDFVLRENGRVREIKNFASEKMPIDVLFLFDVSASMRPHIQRVASAARQALHVLTDKDRVGIMVFDRSTRVRLAFRDNREDIDRDFQNVLRQEGFRGGTDITRGMLDAADYVEQNARRDARRAIVIVTDDETEMQRDDQRVEDALDRAHAVMSALIAPNAMAYNNGGYGGYPGGMGRRRGMGMGGIGMPMPGGGVGYPTNVGSRTHSAGTSEIARDSGGESLPVDDASALETTLEKLRQRYSLYFQLPPGARRGEQRSVEISLADAANRRYSGPDVRYRHTYISPSDGPPGVDDAPVPASVSRDRRPTIRDAGDDTDQPIVKKRQAVSGPGGSSGGPIIIPDHD
jgi:VWFA-related protein